MGWSACAHAVDTANPSSYHHNVEFEGWCASFLKIIVVVAVVWVKAIVVHGGCQKVCVLRRRFVKFTMRYYFLILLLRF